MILYRKGLYAQAMQVLGIEALRPWQEPVFQKHPELQRRAVHSPNRPRKVGTFPAAGGNGSGGTSDGRHFTYIGPAIRSGEKAAE